MAGLRLHRERSTQYAGGTLGVRVRALAARGSAAWDKAGPARALVASGWQHHRLFIVAAAISLLPRVLALLAFKPALFTPDSFDYLGRGVHWFPGNIRPSGYAVLLRLLAPFHSLLLVTALQHLMGIAMAAIVYGVLRHWGLPAWAGVLAAAPTLFDSRQIMMESVIWPDTLYGLLVLGAVALLARRRSPAIWQYAAAGLLIALCSLARGNGLVLIVPVLAYLAIRRAGWRAAGAAAAAFALPVLGYMGMFALHYGNLGITETDGLFLWSRTMSFANCAVIKPPADLLPLCPDRQPRHPAAGAPPWSVHSLLTERSPAEYLWDPGVWWRHGPHPGINARNDRLARRFALDAIRAQPLAYAGTVGKEVGLTFLATDRSLTYRSMHFTGKPEIPVLPPRYQAELRAYAHTTSNTHPVQPFAYFLALYQLPVYFPGVVFLLVIIGGLAGMMRRRGDRRRPGWGGPAGLPWMLAVTGVVVPVALHEYHYRYAITSVSLACLAAGLAWYRISPADGPVRQAREPGRVIAVTRSWARLPAAWRTAARAARQGGDGRMRGQRPGRRTA